VDVLPTRHYNVRYNYIHSSSNTERVDRFTRTQDGLLFRAQKELTLVHQR